MATTFADALNAQYVSRDIPLDLIDEPAVPERESMEAGDLADLAMNIQEIGLIKPLVVKPAGERFEVTAGHRRLLACRMVKYDPVPCRVQVNDQVDPMAILVAENAHTEAVNAVEEARFYFRLLTESCGNDVDLLCIKVRRKRDFVEDRLLLLRGHPRVVDALQARRISIAVARELNKIADPARVLLLLDVSINQGATARQVAQWRREGDALGPIGLPDPEFVDENGPPAPIVAAFQMECLFCESSEHPHMMELVYVHKPCKSILLRMLQRAPAGSQEIS